MESRPRHLFSAVFGLLMAVILSAEAAAQFGSPQSRQPRAEELARPTVFLDRHTIGPGETGHVVILFDIRDSWRLYWKNPGAGALPPDFSLEVPDGFETDEFVWPRPVLIEGRTGDMYCYEDQVAFFLPFTAPPALTDDTVTINVDMTWAVCDENMCLFGRSSPELTIRTTSEVVDDRRSDLEDDKKKLIEKHAARQPTMVHRGSLETGARIEINDQQLILTGPSHGRTEGRFFPYDSTGVSYELRDLSFDREEESFRAVIDLKIDAVDASRGLPTLGGIVVLGDDPSDASYEFHVPFPATLLPSSE
ncbi:MAG: hypothetical protein EA377_09915 [Phycisphaerales bacterium]|nr:MAG: hypothetical protein EA377_09915 [Phycisphaerales bacterium]